MSRGSTYVVEQDLLAYAEPGATIRVRLAVRDGNQTSSTACGEFMVTGYQEDVA